LKSIVVPAQDRRTLQGAVDTTFGISAVDIDHDQDCPYCKQRGGDVTRATLLDAPGSVVVVAINRWDERGEAVGKVGGPLEINKFLQLQAINGGLKVRSSTLSILTCTHPYTLSATS
jgi:hypothetical protein